MWYQFIVFLLFSLDFQSSLIELQLETKVNYRLVNSVKEMGLMVVQYTKAIAEAPFKY
jgi:hypothetical protein